MVSAEPFRPLPAALAGVFAARGWLADQPAWFRELVVGFGLPREVDAGAAVFREGDDSGGFYGVISGAVSVEGGHPRQTPVMGHIVRRGEWFGFNALLNGAARDLTNRALEPTRLLFVPSGRLVPLMRADGDIAIRVSQLGVMSGRLGAWVVRDLATPDAGRRLASVLLRVLGGGEVEPEDASGFWLTHAQLGEMANVSRHYVGRKLAGFEAAGWIGCGYNRIRLLDAAGLAAFAYGDGES